MKAVGLHLVDNEELSMVFFEYPIDTERVFRVEEAFHDRNPAMLRTLLTCLTVIARSNVQQILVDCTEIHEQGR